MKFKFETDKEENRRKSRFLYGESMGGAVTLLLHRKDPTFWDGAVLVAPMCKVYIHSVINIRKNLKSEAMVLCIVQIGLYYGAITSFSKFKLSI